MAILCSSSATSMLAGQRSSLSPVPSKRAAGPAPFLGVSLALPKPIAAGSSKRSFAVRSLDQRRMFEEPDINGPVKSLYFTFPVVSLYSRGVCQFVLCLRESMDDWPFNLIFFLTSFISKLPFLFQSIYFALLVSFVCCLGNTHARAKGAFVSISLCFHPIAAVYIHRWCISNNVNQDDTDQVYDKLFDKYGKVVFSRNDKKSPSAEVDDDAESLSFAVAMAKVASEVKAADIKVLFVKPLVYWTRFFIIATAFSRPQIDAIGSRIRDLAEKQYGKVPSGDAKPNSWTLLDFGDVVVHIFLPQQRDFYNLEEFYGNATPIELPFENQQPPPFRP